MGTAPLWHPSAVAPRCSPFCAVAALAGCGADEPESTPADAAQLEDAPAPIAGLYEQANELLDGGADAFNERLAELKGYPVVVNKWASWCAPCRQEFPYFQRQSARLGEGGRVHRRQLERQRRRARAASSRSTRSRIRATRTPIGRSATCSRAIAFPTTAFYDTKGELAYIKQGGYSSEADLVEDIERYAR